MAIFQLLLVSISFLWHPYHVSTTGIFFNEKEQSVEITVELLSGDFEKTLRKNCRCSIDVIKPKDKNQADNLTKDYIAKNLRIELNDVSTEMSYVGFEQEGPNTLVYFELKNVTEISSVKIVNSLLRDYEKEQVNIVRIKANGHDKTTRLTYPQTEWEVSLKKL